MRLGKKRAAIKQISSFCHQRAIMIRLTSLSLARLVPVLALIILSAIPSLPINASHPPPVYAPKNSWKGITPLRSTVEDVARAVGVEAGVMNLETSNTFKVEDGEVAFSFISASLAKVYRAPRTMVGKVFTIYFTPLAS